MKDISPTPEEVRQHQRTPKTPKPALLMGGTLQRRIRQNYADSNRVMAHVGRLAKWALLNRRDGIKLSEKNITEMSTAIGWTGTHADLVAMLENLRLVTLRGTANTMCLCIGTHARIEVR